MDGSNVTESVTLANADIPAGVGERGHDPLCLMYQPHWRTDYNWNHSDNQFCMLCPIIEAVREDERTAALRDAVEAVKALPNTGGWTTPDGVVYEIDRAKAVAAIEALGGER